MIQHSAKFDQLDLKFICVPHLKLIFLEFTNWILCIYTYLEAEKDFLGK